jgi:ketosteroid isomerase-like protein
VHGAGIDALARSYAAFARRDLAQWLDAFHPDAELLDELSLNPSVYRGHQEMARWFRGWDKVWERIWLSPPEPLREAGDLVVVRWTVRARGKGSGVDVEQDFYGNATFRDAKVACFECYSTESDALEAAGLT